MLRKGTGRLRKGIGRLRKGIGSVRKGTGMLRKGTGMLRKERHWQNTEIWLEKEHYAGQYVLIVEIYRLPGHACSQMAAVLPNLSLQWFLHQVRILHVLLCLY